MQISWSDIKIKAVPPQGRCKKAVGEEKVIIDGVSGSVLPGQFLAIIGASGAGKTTLLNYLSGREISRNLVKTGTILINQTDRGDIKNFSSLSAYVQQDDILFQTMTVKECLTFAAKLKLKGTDESKLAKVDQLITSLKLAKAQHTKIGGPLVKGVSGGERKRTSIGVELITDPTLIFLDEPTTGLDSWTAEQVMDILRDLAHTQGKTIVSTIHQPNTDIYDKFDRLMLLARGKIIFFNEAKYAVDYFVSIGHTCPDLTNPADYFMSMMSRESVELDMLETTSHASQFRNQTMKPKIDEEYNKLIEYFSMKYETSEYRSDPTYSHPECLPIGSSGKAELTTGFFFQWKLLARRNFLNIMRLPQTSYVKLLTTCMTALFALLLFYGPDPQTAGGIQNIQGSLFFVTMNISMNAIQNVILIFPDERPVFLREVNNNMYSASPYFWAKIMSELPFSICTPAIFAAIVYYPLGLNPKPEYFFFFMLDLILAYNASSGYSLIISTSISDKQLAVTLTPVLIIPFMLFAGFFVAASNIPWFLKEFEFLSLFKYSYQALIYNEFDYYIKQDNDPDYFAACAYPNADGSEGNCSPYSQLAGDSTRGKSLLCLAGIYVGCYMISWFILTRLSSTYE